MSLRSTLVLPRERPISASWIALVIVFLVSSCAQPPSQVYTWSELAPDLVKNQVSETQWREAVAMWPMDNGLVHVGAIPEQPLLRFGFGLVAGHSPSIRVRILVGDKQIAEHHLTPDQAWRNVVVFDWPEQAVGQTCSLAIQSDDLFLLGPVELYSRSERNKNLLIVSVDTLRQDHLSTYGYDRDTSPTLDAFAKDALKFSHVTPQSSWTRPSVASLFTGTYPMIHQAQDQSETMREGLPTLAGAMNEAGYATRALVGNDNITPYWGLGTEFQQYDLLRAEDDVIFDSVIAALDEMQGRPWYMYVHAMGPHSPYAPPSDLYGRYQPATDKRNPEEVSALVEKNRGSEAVERIALVLGLEKDIPSALGKPVAQSAQTDVAILKQLAIDLYDAEIRNTDAHLGRLFDAMKEKGLYDDTLIIVLSDHGEEFWEHGQTFHGRTLYEDQLDVPFLMKLPKSEHGGRAVDAMLEQVAIAPTVLDLLALDGAEAFTGRSFKDAIDPAHASDAPVYSSLLNTKIDIHLHSVKSKRAKFLFDAATDTGRWYDLVADPLEQRPMTAPVEGEEHLAARLQDLRKRGEPGLYVLFVSPLEDAHIITATIRSETPHEVQLRYPPQKSVVSQQENQTDIRLDMSPVPEREHFQQQTHALLHISVGALSETELDIRLNGEPLPKDLIHAAAGLTAPLLDGSALMPVEFVANPDDFEPTRLPPDLAVYVWYNPASEALDTSQLDQELIDRLETLGYTD